MDAIDVEDRLRRVKLVAGRPRLRRRLARLAGEPEGTDRVLIAARLVRGVPVAGSPRVVRKAEPAARAAAGSACATTVVVTTYLVARRPPRLLPSARDCDVGHSDQARRLADCLRFS